MSLPGNSSYRWCLNHSWSEEPPEGKCYSLPIPKSDPTLLCEPCKAPVLVSQDEHS